MGVNIKGSGTFFKPGRMGNPDMSGPMRSILVEENVNSHRVL